MKILFLDIDGVVVNADIQGYVRQIELFGDEPIKDFEYIKNSIAFMLENAKRNNLNDSDIKFIENVYKYVSINMFEMLKEYRDCFLEYDNLTSFEAKKAYIDEYSKNQVESINKEELQEYMKYIIKALNYTKKVIECEYTRVKVQGGELNLPFKTINEDNDIISYANGDDPLKRAESALKRMEIYSLNAEIGRDDFLTACTMFNDKEVVDYNEIYTKKNLMPHVVEGLRYLLESGKVDMIVACSHHTGFRETEAKIKLFREELPFVMMYPESLLKFHTEKPQRGKRRERSSKNLQIDKMINKLLMRLGYLGYNRDRIEALLIDDSVPNLEGLVDKKAILYLGDKTSKEDRFVTLKEWKKDNLDYAFEAINWTKDSPKQYIKTNN